MTQLIVDLNSIQSNLKMRNWVHSGDIPGTREALLPTNAHQYHRVDEFTVLQVTDLRAAQSYSLQLERLDLVCIQITISGRYSRSMAGNVDIVNAATIDISNFSRSWVDVNQGEKLRGILIAVRREHLLNHFGLKMDRIPGDFRPLFASPRGMPRVLRLQARAPLYEDAEQILSCKLEGILKSIFVGAKAMQIICALVHQLNGRAQCVSRVPKTERSTQLIEMAAAIYRREFHNPPSVERLSARVGLNRNDLTSGFRDLYGTTPNAYSRMVRMEQAQILLKGTNLSISEIGRRIGYGGYASFARAYREHFGCQPATCFKDD